MTRILIIDDEDLFRHDLALLLNQEGYECATAANGADGIEKAEQMDPEIVLCDLVMPGMNGIQVVRSIKARDPHCVVLVVTAHATLDTAIEAFRVGALDVVLKPVVAEALVNTLRRVEEHSRVQSNLCALRMDVARCCDDDGLVGRSRAMDEVRHIVGRVADRDAPVLISGESGTGKEVVARAIHRAGGRAKHAFVAVNCAAVAATLFESELFGHAKGAFTGADARRRGFFEEASGGTLLLDEVGEIAPEMQGKLLRAVERREVVRVGESRPVPVDVRVIASTNRDLQNMTDEGRFRADLYFRLRVVHIQIPPLRERADDIPLLAEHFVDRLSRRMSLRCTGMEDAAIQALMRHGWPGNVRELMNTIERALILGDGRRIRLDDLPRDIVDDTADAGGSGDDLREATRRAELAHIKRVLRQAGGNRTEAARRLGIDPSTLWRKLEMPGEGTSG